MYIGAFPNADLLTRKWHTGTIILQIPSPPLPTSYQELIIEVNNSKLYNAQQGIK